MESQRNKKSLMTCRIACTVQFQDGFNMNDNAREVFAHISVVQQATLCITFSASVNWVNVVQFFPRLEGMDIND